jgi:uncharacterized repeat protein (TIGR03803 family)
MTHKVGVPPGARDCPPGEHALYVLCSVQTFAILTTPRQSGKLPAVGTTPPRVHVGEPQDYELQKDEVCNVRSESASANGALSWALAFVLGLGAVAAQQAKAQTFTVTHSFTGGSDGANPLSGFYFAGGNLFGTASSGGSSGLGVVFRLSLSGQVAVLHEFTGGTDGASPQGRLVMDKAGNFYGTTTAGGVSNAGTVFKVTRKGIETVLYSFAGKSDGAKPVAGLAIDSAGNLYGTTTAGGTNGNGTVFKLAVPTVSGGEWTEEVLYSFGKGTDGTVPVAGVTFDASGKLYGTTSAGGSHGYGTVFQLTPSGSAWTETILHHFALGSDGGVPYAGLVLGSGGKLYGATTEGGAGGQNGGGTIFELTPVSGGGWTFSELYGLSGWGISGSYRNLLLVNDKIYATTHCDGPDSAGTVYELTQSGSAWTYNPLYNFTGGSDGLFSISNLVADKLGNLYGVTLDGGADGFGVAFKVTP